jgi:hypothetical protein
MADEVGQYPMPDLLDLMRSNLRGAKDIPIRVVLAANPAALAITGSRSATCSSRAWKPYIEPKSKRTWVYAPSTFAGNRFIDREQYRTNSRARVRTIPSSCAPGPLATGR